MNFHTKNQFKNPFLSKVMALLVFCGISVKKAIFCGVTSPSVNVVSDVQRSWKRISLRFGNEFVKACCVLKMVAFLVSDFG